MPELSIHRTAIRSDLPQIVEIYNSTIPSRITTADTEPVSVESRVHWFEEHTPDRRPLWVVEDAGRVAAWLSFSTFYGRPAYAKTAELSVYVHEAFRKRGFAPICWPRRWLMRRRSGSTRCWGSYSATTNRALRCSGDSDSSGGGRCRRSLCWTGSNAISSSSEDA